MASENNYDFSSLVGEDCSILSQLDPDAPIGDLTKDLACQINLLQVALLNSITPAGKLCWHMGCPTKIGKGYIIADGSYYNPSTYPELFNVMGYKYGKRTESNGSSCFRSPDLRGVSIQGMDLGANCIKDVAEYQGFDADGNVIFGDHVGATKKYCNNDSVYTNGGSCNTVNKVSLALPLISTGQICF